MALVDPPAGPATHGQVLLVVVYVAAVSGWLLTELHPWWRGTVTTRRKGDGGEDGAAAHHGHAHADADAETATTVPPHTVGAAAGVAAAAAVVADSLAQTPDRFAWWRPVLRAATVFGGIVTVIYLVDGPHGLGHDIPQERVYDRDLFVFIVLVLILIGVLTGRTVAPTGARPRGGAASANAAAAAAAAGAGGVGASVSAGASDAPAVAPVATAPSNIFNRDQSEEWKGVMQTGFVLYHYFAAKETYNVIRLFIAAYVWMTGFGNLSFFWTRKDYGWVRTAKMLVRLNLLVAVVATALNKEYMLYYVCPLHTSCFLLTYAVMAIGHERNGNRAWLQAKLAAALVLLFVMFEVPGVFEIVWAPLWWLMAYEGSLHEWHFRARLDHYIIWIGMVCAYAYPTAERWLLATEAHPDVRRQRLAKATLAAVALGGVLWWIAVCFGMDKYAYNTLHPYVSWIPLLGYLVLRNLTPYLRQRVRPHRRVRARVEGRERDRDREGRRTRTYTQNTRQTPTADCGN
jgi:hypothetical protein